MQSLNPACADVTQLQAWNRRIKKLLPKELQPIARHVQMRSEFSGVGTAEQSLRAAANLCKEEIQIDCLSCGDWSNAARSMCELNHPNTCRFKDIMGMAPNNLRQKLTEDIVTEVRLQ